MNPGHPLWNALEQINKGHGLIYQQIQQNRLDQNIFKQNQNIANLALNLTQTSPLQNVCDSQVHPGMQSNLGMHPHSNIFMQYVNGTEQQKAVYPKPIPKRPIHPAHGIEKLPQSFTLAELSATQSLVTNAILRNESCYIYLFANF